VSVYFSGAGVSLGFLAPFAIVGAIYKEPGFPLALVTVFGSVGQMVMPYVYEIFLTYYHWSGAFILLAGISLQGIPCGLFIHYSHKLLDTSEKETATSSSDVFGIELLADYATWLYLIITLVTFATGMCFKQSRYSLN
jgi:MFS family permease